MIRTLKQAEGIAGSLGNPSKMPGYAYGIPATECKVGAQLAKIPGSVCANCYALKGRYMFPNVQDAQRRRFESLYHPQWVEAIVFMLRKRKAEYFRWHDSGDLQGMTHLTNIVAVANQVPECKFWLPTRENALIAEYLRDVGDFPNNLVVRVSGAMVDGEAPVRFLNTSTVSSTKGTCPAPQQGNSCGDCRACWDRNVRNISYKEH
jgi:hypothetical protein